MYQTQSHTKTHIQLLSSAHLLRIFSTSNRCEIIAQINAYINFQMSLIMINNVNGYTGIILYLLDVPKNWNFKTDSGRKKFQYSLFARSLEAARIRNVESLSKQDRKTGIR